MDTEKIQTSPAAIKVIELEIAKANVKWLLDNNGLVDMHGLEHWAGVVERLRQELGSI